MPRLAAATRGIGASGNRRAKRVTPSARHPVTPSRSLGAKDARGLALDILRRVETTDAYANLLLDARLQRSRLARPDRALTTELVYGVLRWRGKLDWILRQVLDRPIEALDPPVRHALRLGVYQLCCLDRIPDFAAVDETVRLVRSAGAGKSAGFVNAVLRSVARRRSSREADPSADPAGYWSTVGSHPRWLAERWIARLGAEEAGQLMTANNAVPPVTVLVNTLKVRAEDARKALSEAGAAVDPGRWIPGALTLRGAGDLGDLPGFAEGWLIPMDEAGALPVLALDVEPGQRVLDVCAGGGSKSALIAARVGSRGEVLALDRSPRAMRRLEAAIQRLGLTCVRPHLADARVAGARWPGQFARVLLDVPCSGLGTIRRRPEIRWRRQESDLARAAILQSELLSAAAEAVATDGLLVYSTCSLEPEETDAVIAAFLAANPTFRLDPPGAPLPPGANFVERDGLLRAWPHRHETDGFFVARLRRLG